MCNRIVDIVAVLESSRDLLARPGGWSKNTFARDARGIACPFSSIDAVSFCSVGAIGAVVHRRYGVGEFVDEGLSDAAVLELLVRAAVLELLVRLTAYDAETFDSVPEFNDAPETTLQDVLELFERTIDALRRRIVETPPEPQPEPEPAPEPEPEPEPEPDPEPELVGAS